MQMDSVLDYCRQLEEELLELSPEKSPEGVISEAACEPYAGYSPNTAFLRDITRRGHSILKRP